MYHNGSGDGAGVGSWMDKPGGNQSYNSIQYRPGGMSDDSEYDDDDDYDYCNGFDLSDQRRSKKRYVIPQDYWKTPGGSYEPKLTPAEKLEKACKEKDINAVKEVLAGGEVGINDAIFTSKWTVLMLACKYAAFEIIEYLILENADVNFRGVDMYTPLIALTNSDASFLDDLDLEKSTQLLLSKGGSVDCHETHGFRPLIFAIMYKRVHLVQILLENGANVDTPENTGLTPLHYAAREGSGQIVRMLLEKGADVTAKDAMSGLTPLETARNSINEKCSKVIQILDWVETTKWRPGEHPDLIDEVISAGSRFSEETAEADFYQGQSENVELTLVANNMEKYVPLIRKHKVTSNQFMWMNHAHLMELGIEDENDRNAIIEDQKLNRREQDKLPPPYMREGWTSYEVFCMLSNIETHIDYQTEILEGLYRSYKEDLSILESGIETYTPTDIIEGSNRVTESTYKLQKSSSELRSALADFQKIANRKSAVSESKLDFTTLLTIFGIIGLSVGLGISVMRHRS